MTSARVRDVIALAALRWWSLGFLVGTLLGVLLSMAALGECSERKPGIGSTRVTVSPRGFHNPPVEAVVRVIIDEPTEDWYCPSVEVVYHGPLGDERSTSESDCAPFDEWVAENDQFAIRGGQLVRIREPRRVDMRVSRRLNTSGTHGFTVTLRQGKKVWTRDVAVVLL